VLAPPTAWWHRLAARIPVRLDPGRGGALGVGVAVAMAAVLTGLWLSAQRPHSVPVSAAAPQLTSAASPVGTGGLDLAASTAPPAVTGATRVVVDVAGKVRRPGLYRLPAGARVDDALRAAGGPLRRVDLSSLNLAARVVDGQQILVGVAGGPAAAGPPAGGPAPAPAASSTAPVSLNSATLEQLEALPGIGPVLAQEILDWRAANGGFTSIDQLTQVSGIGDVTFADLRPLVTL